MTLKQKAYLVATLDPKAKTIVDAQIYSEATPTMSSQYYSVVILVECGDTYAEAKQKIVRHVRSEGNWARTWADWLAHEPLDEAAAGLSVLDFDEAEASSWITTGCGIDNYFSGFPRGGLSLVVGESCGSVSNPLYINNVNARLYSSTDPNRGLGFSGGRSALVACVNQDLSFNSRCALVVETDLMLFSKVVLDRILPKLRKSDTALVICCTDSALLGQSSDLQRCADLILTTTPDTGGVEFRTVKSRAPMINPTGGSFRVPYRVPLETWEDGALVLS